MDIYIILYFMYFEFTNLMLINVMILNAADPSSLTYDLDDL